MQKRLALMRQSFFVPATGVISNQFLDDLEMIWALRDVIPAIQFPLYRQVLEI